jgi:hypothetical protein
MRRVGYGAGMAVDWGSVRARVGDHVCPVHGVVEPWRQVVPACRDCGRVAHLAVAAKTGVVFVEPAPGWCAGDGHHRLGPGRMLLGSRACSCAPDGAHRTWTCVEPGCGNVQQWPEHREVDTAPYFGPGSG